MPVSHTASEGIAQRVKGEGRVSGKDGGRLWVGWQLMDEGSRGKRTLEKMQFAVSRLNLRSSWRVSYLVTGF